MANAYSFKSIVGSIAGPGGNIPIGNSSGSAEEGITAEMIEEKDLMTVGADGQIMHSLRASDAGRVTVRLLKTSPINAALNQMYNFQKTNPGNWGQNQIVFRDVYRGDVITLSEGAFARQANIAYQKDGNVNEWIFLGNLDMLLGNGTPSLT